MSEAAAAEALPNLFRDDISEAEKREFLAFAQLVEAQMRAEGISLEIADA